MSGTSLGFLKGKLGLKGGTNRGDMISRMNHIKNKMSAKPAIKKGSCKNCGGEHKGAMCPMASQCKTCGANHKTGSCVAKKAAAGIKKLSKNIVN